MEMTNLPFPPKAEDALVSYATHLIMRLPGKERDLKLSEVSLARYNSGLSGCRAIADTGESGSRNLFDFLPREG